MNLFKDYEIRLKDGWADISELDGKIVAIAPFTKNCKERVSISKKHYRGKFRKMANEYSEIEVFDNLVIVNQFITSEINKRSLMIICFLTCVWKQEKCYFPHIVYENFKTEFEKKKYY